MCHHPAPAAPSIDRGEMSQSTLGAGLSILALRNYPPHGRAPYTEIGRDAVDALTRRTSRQNGPLGLPGHLGPSEALALLPGPR